MAAFRSFGRLLGGIAGRPGLAAAAAVGATGVLASGLVCYKKPVVLVKGYLKLEMIRAGLKEYTVPVGELNISYCERGQKVEGQPTMLLVHGFTTSKEMWLSTVRHIPKDTHVILVDLPGHGKSSLPPPHADVSADRFVQYLKKFIAEANIDTQNLHLVGISFGGVLCALYSAKNPTELNRLTLVCPGMISPVETNFQRNMRLPSETCALLPDTPAGVQAMADLTRYNKTHLPKPVLNGILQLRQPRQEFYQELYEETRLMYQKQNPRSLKKLTKNIRAPVQIIWGRQDEVFHVTGADRLRQMLPNLRRLDILENCGHSCSTDCPKQVAACLHAFHQEALEESDAVRYSFTKSSVQHSSISHRSDYRKAVEAEQKPAITAELMDMESAVQFLNHGDMDSHAQTVQSDVRDLKVVLPNHAGKS